MQAIFALYLQHRSFDAVLAEANAQRWTTKSWRTREGKEHLGRPFTKATLIRLLTNVLYLGQVSHWDVVYPGEHAAIVNKSVCNRVKRLLDQHKTRSLRVAKRFQEAQIGKSPTAQHGETERVPRVTRLLALALKFEEMIRNGVVDNFTMLAELGQVSRARVSQMMNLLNLAPDIQEEILFLTPVEAKRLRLSEPAVRKLSAILDWVEKRAQWSRLRSPAGDRFDSR